MRLYRDRQDAGKQLARLLKDYIRHKETIVLALPRGGVPVAYEVAQALSAPLDVFIVRKLGVPGNNELAMGAIAGHDTLVLHDDIINSFNITSAEINLIREKELFELARREKAYRGNKPFPDLKDKAIILIDDGAATGATLQAAILALKKRQPSAIICAVPVASDDAYALLSPLVDNFICPLIRADFIAVGNWYQEFEQTTDEEVMACLQRSI